MNIQETILDQNPHWGGERGISAGEKEKKNIYPARRKQKNDYVRRRILDELKLDSDLIEVITGVRRSGKSTIFDLVMELLMNKQKAKPEEILLLNLDHPAFIPYYTSPERLDEIVEQAEISAESKIKYIFLDEIQNIRMWEKWVKAKYDAGSFQKIFVTGSNADLLAGDYISRLSGRFFGHINYPFSFPEFLDCREQTYYRSYAKNHGIKYKLIGLFDEYLRLGGFPEVARSGNKELLDNYYETIILKDVIAGHQIRDSLGLRQVAYYLISNAAKPFTYNNIGNNLDIHENTVKEYIGYLKSAYLFDELFIFSPSVKTQQRNPRKIYCVDNGLMYAVGFQFSLNSGRYLENLVFGELKRNYSAVYYHKNKGECDFVVGEKNKQGKINIKQAIQVCYDLNIGNKDRELEGLLEAMREHGLSRGKILTYNTYDVIHRQNKKIILMPVWRWLLE